MQANSAQYCKCNTEILKQGYDLLHKCTEKGLTIRTNFHCHIKLQLTLEYISLKSLYKVQ